MTQAAPITDPAQAASFILAGNAYFTVVSEATGKRYTYRVRKASDELTGIIDQPERHFVSVLFGPDNTGDYAYVGLLENASLRLTAKSRVTCDDPRAKAAGWALGNILERKRIPDGLELWHEGRCGRCARLLTDPVSIARGLGPECAGRLS